MQNSRQGVERFRVEKLKIEVHSDREAAGAAEAAAETLKKLSRRGGSIGVKV